MRTKFWNVWWTATIATLLLFTVKSSDVKRIRHYRHLPQEYNPNGAISYSNDNHVPTFPDCNRYKPTIKEDQPTGTFVIIVKAEDPDPIASGGNITYSLVSDSEQHKFFIDPVWGNISTKYMFDRDEPRRETEADVIVRATDNGRPPLDGICQFKVTIEDVNDNPPIFDRQVYNESISQDTKVGTVVVRITATDLDDGPNKDIEYTMDNQLPLSDNDDYFAINKDTGVVTLTKEIDKNTGHVFRIRVTATDKDPNDPRSSLAELSIKVVASDKKAPYFVNYPSHELTLKENYNDRSSSVFTLEAESNTDEPAPLFRLNTGKTEQTNSGDTFKLKQTGKTANLYVYGPLDYEKIREYMLTIRIENKYDLAAEHVLNVYIEDVNDNEPKFTKKVTSGTVLENQPPGTDVMQVQAIDLDVSPEFRNVSYRLQDHRDKFAIDPHTGRITTRISFDREIQDAYNVKVIANDGAPSARSNDNEPNIEEQVFRISIADANDHPPKFQKREYSADIPENVENNTLVVDVLAEDVDTSSNVTYSIIRGNEDEAFYIVHDTGQIKTRKKLDYEKIKSYSLQVVASDGLAQDECSVEIKIRNVNDENPQFLQYIESVEIFEETLKEGCIVQVRAFDPDIADRNQPQRIVYSLLKEEQKDYLAIDNDGCLSLIRPLDRDPPDGLEKWQVIIKANDDDGPSTPGSLSNTATLYIHLKDINDNAPRLNVSEPVVWRENQPPGRIVELTASDADGPTNGGPFSFVLDSRASDDIRSKFAISYNYLEALVEFDREKQKEYIVPIAITDNGVTPQTGVSYLRVTIGDENDNKMTEGSSNIFVYYYEEAHYDIQIGRVYVNDLDDWDLADKEFEWDNSYNNDIYNYFTLDTSTGMITMSKAPATSYFFQFRVTEDPKNGKFSRHTVMATVNVTVKQIPAEAVRKSGSIRFSNITAEQFITKNMDGISKADILRSFLAETLNNTEENVDVFTVLQSPLHENESIIDVRFSAHGSPYYAPERLNVAIVRHQDELESQLGARMLMVGVDECLNEQQHCEGSCINELVTANKSAPVFTNTTSFVGIYAYVQHKCQCEFSPVSCYNGGILTAERRCQCPERTEGLYCEQTSIGFTGNGWALYPTLDVCNEMIIKLHVRTTRRDGLIFYVGPEMATTSSGVPQDFMSLELENGSPTLLVDYGTGTTKIRHHYNTIVDEMFHKIEIQLRPDAIQLIVDDCNLQKCLNLAPPHRPNKYLNVNGPLQVGGTYMNVHEIGYSRNWQHKPATRGFSGCIQNFTVNDKPYNLGSPSMSFKADFSCSSITSATFVFGFDWSFMMAIIICLVILTILLMAVVVHRRKVEDMYRDTDDIRENIINYEDEGGGEGDMTGYDLNVLRLHYDDPTGGKYMNGMLPTIGADEVPDICGFLDDKKHTVDNDPETLPFDDVRHYAYEGDGNTTGSLSSLASGTDEGDLNFDYLSNFGPRFRKLADMYGEDGSDEDSDTYHNATSESWC